MKSKAQVTLPLTPMVLERSSGHEPMGAHASTMELYVSETDPCHAMIEWDIPSMERTEHIGLTFERMTNGDLVLSDYDGVMSLPAEAVKFLRDQKYLVGAEFE